MMYVTAARMSMAIAMVGGAANAASAPARADAVAYLVNVTVRPGYNFRNAAATLLGTPTADNDDDDTQLAAQRHANDVLGNRGLDGDIGSDGSTPKDRAAAAGFRGQVAGTVAINPAVAIN